MQRKKSTEEMGEGPLKTPSYGSWNRGRFGPYLVGGCGFVPLIGKMVVLQPEGPARMPPSVLGLVGDKLHPLPVTLVAIKVPWCWMHEPIQMMKSHKTWYTNKCWWPRKSQIGGLSMFCVLVVIYSRVLHEFCFVFGKGKRGKSVQGISLLFLTTGCEFEDIQ